MLSLVMSQLRAQVNKSLEVVFFIFLLRTPFSENQLSNCQSVYLSLIIYLLHWNAISFNLLKQYRRYYQINFKFLELNNGRVFSESIAK